MDYLLPGSRIRLTYLQDKRDLITINWASIHEDLADAGTPMNRGRWCDLDALTHVVLACDSFSARYVGVLGLTRRDTPPMSWLMTEIILVRPDETDGNLTRTLLAHALVRIFSVDVRPVALAAPKSAWEGLRDLQRMVRSVTMYPPSDSNVIPLETARLARDIGAGTILLDLRQTQEPSLTNDLRDLHGLRPERLKSPALKASGDPAPMGGPARTGGTTRRPRKATQTGRTG